MVNRRSLFGVRVPRVVLLLQVALMLLPLSRVRGQSPAEEVCRPLAAADVQLKDARAQGAIDDIFAARSRLEDALRSGSCAAGRALYRAHVAESRCDQATARDAYADYLALNSSDASHARVELALSELDQWRSARLRPLDEGGRPVDSAKLGVLCTWPVSANESSACAFSVEPQRLREFERPPNATCRYAVVDPAFERIVDTLPTSAGKVDLKLRSLQQQGPVDPPDSPPKEPGHLGAGWTTLIVAGAILSVIGTIYAIDKVDAPTTTVVPASTGNSVDVALQALRGR
jgi:hypothetical protein